MDMVTIVLLSVSLMMAVFSLLLMLIIVISLSPQLFLMVIN
ncbi:hypothetical protein NT01EI_3074 [Edwardsiella ictaluri 93-146]|uniref:Uncharacterized protein n=1 Tax=Edwardsiella ictaluri (strain 93-146) TaxID=634503 RepID=C5BAL7_EDWI9|nr:hypothetical protein NT01EI_3074 [Edwardsiella ictaluri 93-146]